LVAVAETVAAAIHCAVDSRRTVNSAITAGGGGCISSGLLQCQYDTTSIGRFHYQRATCVGGQLWKLWIQGGGWKLKLLVELVKEWPDDAPALQARAAFALSELLDL
jgi:hypothetical protein